MYQPSSFYEKRIFNSSRFIHPNKSSKPIEKIKKNEKQTICNSPLLEQANVASHNVSEEVVKNKSVLTKNDHLNDVEKVKTPKDDNTKTIENVIARIDKIEKFLYNTDKGNMDFVIDTLIDKLNIMKTNITINSPLCEEVNIDSKEELKSFPYENSSELDVSNHSKDPVENKGIWYLQNHSKYDKEDYRKYYKSSTSDNKLIFEPILDTIDNALVKSSTITKPETVTQNKDNRENITNSEHDIIYESNVQEQSAQNEKEENLEAENVKPENLEQEIVEDVRIEQANVEAEIVQPENLEQEIVEDVQQENVEAEIVQPENLEQEIVEDVRIEQENVEAEIVQPENLEQEIVEDVQLEQENVEQENVRQEILEDLQEVNIDSLEALEDDIEK